MATRTHARFLRLTLAIGALTLGQQACDRQGEAERVAAAQAMLDKHDAAAAVVQLKDTLGRFPESIQARLLLGRALVQAGDAESALIELEKIEGRGQLDTQVMPEIARALLARGESAKVVGRFADTALADPAAQADLRTSVALAQVQLGRTDLARQAAQAALADRPTHVPAVVLLARLQAADGDVDGALRRLDEVLAREPGQAVAGVLKGELMLRERKQMDGALAAFRQVLTASPGNLQAQSALVNTLVFAGRTADAKTEFGALQKLAPNHPETVLLQAQFAFDDGDARGARDLAERVLGQKPQHARALLLAGASEFRLGQYRLAESLLERALKVAPDLVLARQLLAQTHLRSGQPARAIETLQPLTAKDSADVASLNLLGQAYLDSGDARRAEEVLRRALKRSPQDAAARSNLALAQLSRGEAAAPVLSQLESISAGDKGSTADLALIGARLSQNDLAGALKAADALVVKNPDQAHHLVLRAQLQQRSGDLPGAADSFAKALAKDPADFSAAAGLAELDFAAGRSQQARRRFEDLLQRDPRHVRAKVALAGLDARLGLAESKIQDQLRDAIKLDPTQSLAHLALIDRLLSARDIPAALQAAQDAVAALPNDPLALDALGRVHLAAGDGVQAVATFKKLVAMQPTRSLHQTRLADAYLVSKDRAGAGAALRRAVELDPRNLQAQRGLAVMAVQDKRGDEALQRAREIQKQMPADAAGFAIEGEVEGLGKNWTAAAAAYAQALKRDPRVDWAILQHMSLTQAGKGADADRVLADWKQRHPKDATFTYYLGDQAVKARDWAAAETRYRAVLAVQPDHPGALNNLAWLLATQRKPGAVDMAQRAVARMPDKPALLDTLALALESDNQLAKAVETQKKAAELDPRNPALRLRLAKLLIKKGDKSDARDELTALQKLGNAFRGQAEVSDLLSKL